ncbi:MAG: hypothetical protein ACRCXT_08390 [Paraclostridium sp.]
MKYIIIILISFLLISTTVDEDLTNTSLIRQCIYNYITCLSSSFDYLGENVEVFAQLQNIPYERTYSSVMENRILVKHYVENGENIDQIIKKYNPNIDSNLGDLREVIYKENTNIVSSDYQVKSGEYILVPCEKK